MSDHTPEPWKRCGQDRGGCDCRQIYDDYGIVAVALEADRDFSFTCGEGPKMVLAKANARRIVACVNACAGISNELLEQHPAAISEVYAQSLIATEAELTALRQQVADLRAALEDICNEAEGYGWDEHDGKLSHIEYVTFLFTRRVLAATQPQEVQP